MFKVIVLFAVLLFSAHIESAEYPSHVGKSPFSFDKINTPSNTFVVSDKGQDNDVYLKRDDAKIFDFQFSLKIDRYVGDVAKLKENKLISDKFKISLPVFDVDNESVLQDCDYDGEFATELRTNKFNVITHSKGGLDSRWFINRLAKEKLLVQVGEMDNTVVRDTLLVNSLVTHSSPHYGTVLADAIDEGFYVGSIFSGLIKMNIDDICDLRTDTATEFTNSKRITDAIKFLAIGANIDANNDGKISDEESLHNQLRTDVIDYSGSAYRLIRDVKEYVVKLRPGTGQWPTEGNAVYVPYVEAVPNISPEPNDSLVSISSASPSDAMKVEKTVGNHATVLYGQSWHQVWTGAQDIVIDEAIVGMLKWSVGNETH